MALVTKYRSMRTLFHHKNVFTNAGTSLDLSSNYDNFMFEHSFFSDFSYFQVVELSF